MIDLHDVGMTFEHDGAPFDALRDVSFSIREGEFASLIGPSGCGKTTLLKIVAGLLRQTSGEVFIDSSPVAGPGNDRAFIFQNFVLLPWADVMTNVSFGLEARGVGREERLLRAAEELARVGLTGFENHYPHQLSGGMQQRVGIARALAVDPRILLLDEPFGALDALTRQLMQKDLLALWQRSERRTALFVTHSMDEAVFLSDRVILMNTRPGRVDSVIDVPFGRPRTEDVVRSQEYREVVTDLWSRLEQMQRADMETRG